AAEAPLSGRSGFGVATESVTWTVDVRAAALHAEAADRAARMRVDHVTDAELRPAAPDVYTRPRQPGDIDRWDIAWDTLTGTAPEEPSNAKPGVSVIARDAAGVPQGILRYTIDQKWDEHAIGSVAHVGLLD